jgi:D-alanine-D-alanine ligase
MRQGNGAGSTIGEFAPGHELSPDIIRLAVITGDPRLFDSAKVGGRRSAADEAAHRTMEAAFRGLGRFEIAFLDHHLRLIADLESFKPELVVNLCDTGLFNIAHLEPGIPALLEALAIPYTGTGPSAMRLATDKAATRLIARELGIDVPAEVFIRHGHPLPELPHMYPALVKPNATDGSLGILTNAVASTRDEFCDRMVQIRAMMPSQDLLVQEYLPGEELSFATLGNPGIDFRMLPVAEWELSGYPDDAPRILNYESKNLPDSPFWWEAKLKPAQLEPGEVEMLRGCAEALVYRIRIQDYARFDVRRDGAGRLKLLEVNPNPAWGACSVLAYTARLAGIAYPRLLKAIVETAVARLRSTVSPFEGFADAILGPNGSPTRRSYATVSSLHCQRVET